MTIPAYHTEKMTDFSLWIRSCCKDSKDGLSLTNLDFIITDYKQRLVMMVEEKTHGKNNVSFGQRQIFNLLHKALKHYCGSDLEDWQYRGFYLVVFSHNGPEDSDWITVNHVKVTADQLRRFLNFEISFSQITN